MTTEAISLAGALRIRQLAALIEQCDLFVTNDTGPMHVAAAMHTPTVALFGPGDISAFSRSIRSIRPSAIMCRVTRVNSLRTGAKIISV